MSEIKRVKVCTPTKNSVSIEYADDGQFVNYQDHLAAIEQAKIEAVREFVDKNIPKIDPTGLDEVKHCCESCLYHERERIHAAAAKKLKGKVNE